MGLTIDTMDGYRERMVALKLTGNQQIDEEEARMMGRKYMVWNIPRAATNEKLGRMAKAFFGSDFESSTVTMSKKLHPYAWFILKSAEGSLQHKAAGFEDVLQSVWPEIVVGNGVPHSSW